MMLFELLSCVDTQHGWRGPTVKCLAVALERIQSGSWMYACGHANNGRDVAQVCGDQAGRDFLDLTCAAANFARALPDDPKAREKAFKATKRAAATIARTKERNLHNAAIAQLVVVWCCHKEREVNRWRVAGWKCIDTPAAQYVAGVYLASARKLLDEARKKVYTLDRQRHERISALLDELEWEPEPVLALEGG